MALHRATAYVFALLCCHAFVQAERSIDTAAVEDSMRYEAMMQEQEQLRSAIDFEARLVKMATAGLSANQDLICGTSKIKQELHAGAQNLRWSSIIAEAENFISKQDQELREVLGKIDAAQQDLEAALKAEAVPELSTNQEKLSELFEPVFAFYEGKQNMMDSKCGEQRISAGPGLPKKKFIGLFHVSIDALKAKIEGSLADPNPRYTMMNAEDTARTCMSLLGMSDADVSCKLFCSEAAATARTFTSGSQLSSYTGLVGVHKSAEIEASLQLLTSTLATLQSLKTDCQNARDELVQFQSHMQSLDKDVQSQRAVSAKVSDELRDANWDLEDLTSQSQDQASQLQQLAAALNAAQVNEASLLSELAQVQTQAVEVQDSMGQHLASLKAIEKEVELARMASEGVQEFQSKLSTLLLRLVMFYDQAVRKPLELMGFGLSVDIAEKFPKAAVDSVEKDSLASLSDITSFCNEDSTKVSLASATAAVAKHGGSGDFAEMCHLPDVSQTAESIQNLISDKQNSIIELLKTAQSWTDPMRGQEKDQSADGNLEINGLRKAISIYSSLEFYTKYLKKWKNKDRKMQTFPQLIAALGNALAQDQESKVQMETAAKDLASQMGDLQNKIDELQAKLATALAARKGAQGDVEAAEAISKKLDDDQKALRELIARLQQNAKEATQALEESQTVLQNTYKSAIALLQLIEDTQGEERLLREVRPAQ